MRRRIVPCGGRLLFHPALMRYIFEKTGKARPRVLFLPTASGDSADYLLTFYRELAGADAELAHLALFDRTVIDIPALVTRQDVIVVGGGNTANMLAIWRRHGVEQALRDAYAGGTILTGWSAGCICWFEQGITDSFDPDLGPLHDGLGLLSGSACPHYDAQPRRAVVYAREIANGLRDGIALDDGVAALYEDERLVEVVSGRPDGRAFRVGRSGAEPMLVRVLS